MMQSNLVKYVKLSPNNSGERTATIDRITPHCVVGQCTVESLGEWFANPALKASSNYGIGKTGDVGLYVPENMRSWCSSSSVNDNRAITIECASETVSPYVMNESVYATLINLCTDICRRYDRPRLIWIPDKVKALNYEPDDDEMLLTVHRWFANKSCPGDWLYSRLGTVADIVTRRLENVTNNNVFYRVQVGAFRNREYAEKMVKELTDAGFNDSFVVAVKN